MKVARWFAVALLCAALALTGGACRDAPKARESKAGEREAGEAPTPKAPAPKGEAQSPGCRALPFEDTVPVVEASGAAIIPGSSELFVVGDSGTRGSFAVIDATSGALKRSGRLPLDTSISDDLEGAAFRGGKLYTLASNGYMQQFEAQGDSWVRKDSAYPIAPKPWQCSPKRSNCGSNFEGLCLSQRDHTPCVGYAVAKKSGILYCLVEQEGRLALSQEHYIRVARPRALSGCYISEDDRLLVGSNVFGGNYVYEVKSWHSGKPEISPIGRIGPGNSEAIAINRNGEIIRFADNGVRTPSPVKKYECSR